MVGVESFMSALLTETTAGKKIRVQ